MDNFVLIIVFVLLILGIVSIFLWAYYSAEKKKKKKIRDSFKNFSEKTNLEKENLRTVPRLKLPESFHLILTLTDEPYFGLTAIAYDISETGFSVKPDFPLRKLPVYAILNNVLVRTPMNDIVIDKIKTIRYEHEIKKRLLAFEIVSIDENQKNKLLLFINYLDKYIKDEN